MGDEMSGDAEYLVFDETNYYRYKQFIFLNRIVFSFILR